MPGDLAALARALRRREVSSAEVVERSLADLGRVGPELHALACLTPSRARRAARRADLQIRRGEDGPLVGIPFGAKDLIRAEDDATTADAAVVRRLERAGAVLVAKLAVENAGSGWSRLGAVAMVGGDGRRPQVAARPFGYGVNPWDRNRWSGGSSSGSAIAVAAGLVPFALGTETSGSLVAPAAFCGLSALRPTHGLVPLDGVVPLAWSLDKVGVLAWSVADVERAFAALRARRAPAARPALGRIRVGIADEDLDHASPAARRPLERGLAEIAGLGVRVVRAAIPEGPYAAMVETVMRAEGATTFGELIRRGRLAELVSARQRPGIEAALALPAHEYLSVMRQRAGLQRAFGALFRTCDVIVAPAQLRTAPTLAEMSARGSPTQATSPALPARRPGNTQLTPAANLAGLPAVVVPCGLGDDGMPVGMQLVGPPRSEPALLALAAAYQRATEHHLRRPG